MENKLSVKKFEQKNTFLGIEFGSTRIKAVLIDRDFTQLASGSYDWENRLEKGIWTYSDKDIWEGLQEAYRKLSEQVKEKTGDYLHTVGSIGFSAMMHGYLPFDKTGKQLVPFRTWRNTSTETAAEQLTSVFKFNIPQRWSIAHLYQAILDEEEHVKEIDFLTTLSGYIHWKLTGEKVLGIGEASGMFPIDHTTNDYDSRMVDQFNNMVNGYNYDWSLKNILPKVLNAGEISGILTEEGARLLDPKGELQPGIPLCPPEGDAGTGMVATNSVAERTGNVSAGTSIFSMIVLDEKLSNYYKEIDIVTTPSGKPVAMVHCNNFTSDINAWAGLFSELIKDIGVEMTTEELFTTLFTKAMQADVDCGGIVSCNYYSGEPITGFEEGRPLMVRMPDSKLSLANFMRAQIFSALATLKMGMDILTEEENVKVDYLLGHGGFFKTEDVGQQIMADAIKAPVSVMKTAGEGGPWGMAVLAAYAVEKKAEETLEQFLETIVFANETIKTLLPSQEGVESFTSFMEKYKRVLEVERTAVDSLTS